MREKNSRGNVLGGVDALAQALKFEDFPCTKQELYYNVGELEIQGPGGERTSVGELLQTVQESYFMTPREALSAICRAAELRQPSAA